MSTVNIEALLADDAVRAAVHQHWGGHFSPNDIPRWRECFKAAIEVAQINTLPTEAATRAGDPSTSRAAALSIPDLRRSQLDVLRVFEDCGPTFTDEELVAKYNEVSVFNLIKPQSPSGIRSRRNELTRGGLLRDSGKKRKMTTGRMAVVWELKP